MKCRKTGPAETFASSSPEETRRLAGRLVAALPAGSVVALSGPLGAGKTVFVKGMAAALGIPGRRATSPTFTIINEYEGSMPLFHVDLYRLEDRTAVLDLGLQEYFDGDGIVALEWPERAAGLLPERTVAVTIERRGSRSRQITIRRP